MAETWLSAKQIGDLMDLHVQHVRKLAAGSRWTSQPSEKPLANGRREALFVLTSLPESAQLKYQEQIAKNTQIIVRPDAILEKTAKPAVELISSPRDAEFANAAPRERGDVPEQFRERVAERKAAIAPLTEIGKLSGRSRHQQFAELLAKQAELTGNSAATLRRWLNRYRTRGEAGLAPKLREDEKESRFFREHSRAAAFCQSKAVGENLSNQLVWRALCREWTALGEEGETPSYNTVRRYLKNAIRPDITVLAREGKREYTRTQVPTIVRDTRGILANEWWVMDHRVHDVFVYNTVFPGEVLDARKMYRPWMSLTWDWGSRKIVGVVWAPTPSSRTINASLRIAVSECGLPRNFYWDNGKDYQAVGRVFMAEDLAGILKSNEVEITNALPYNARSKPIEPFFQLFSKGFDRMWGVGYCSNKPQLASAKCRDAQKHHKDFFEGKAHETPLRSDKEFILAAAQFIDEYNAQANDLLGGRSPNDVFAQQAPPDSRRMVERRMLDQLFWQRDTRTVHQGGCVELNKLRYEPRDDSSFAVLIAKVKQEVTVARDPWDLGTAVAFDAESGEFLGELQIQQAVAQSAHGRLSVDGIRAMARRKNAMLSTAALYCAGLEAMAEANNWLSEPDALLQRAGVAATGTDGRVSHVAPGAQSGLPAPSEPRRLRASPFVSDGVKSLMEISEDE